MLEISSHIEGSREEYKRNALYLLKFIARNRCNFTLDTDNLVERCTAAYHDEKHEFSIIYGDYFFIEGIWKLTGQELFIW